MHNTPNKEKLGPIRKPLNFKAKLLSTKPTSRNPRRATLGNAAAVDARLAGRPAATPRPVAALALRASCVSKHTHHGSLSGFITGAIFWYHPYTARRQRGAKMAKRTHYA
jgi:hypothetical protein